MRLELSGVGKGVGVAVGVDVGDGVEVAVGLGGGVGVSSAVAVAAGVGLEVVVAVAVGDGVPRGGCALADDVELGVVVAVGVPSKPAAGSRRHTRASGDDPARGDDISPSCTTVSKSSSAARNQ